MEVLFIVAVLPIRLRVISRWNNSSFAAHIILLAKKKATEFPLLEKSLDPMTVGFKSWANNIVMTQFCKTYFYMVAEGYKIGLVLISAHCNFTIDNEWKVDGYKKAVWQSWNLNMS